MKNRLEYKTLKLIKGKSPLSVYFILYYTLLIKDNYNYPLFYLTWIAITRDSKHYDKTTLSNCFIVLSLCFSLPML